MTGNQTATAALRAAVRVETISQEDTGRMPAEKLAELKRVLKQHFPLFHDRFECHEVSESGGICFHWPGQSSESPVVLMGHLDVVPIDDEDAWDFEPFGAELDAGRILGRGTLDDKGSVISILAAAEELLAEGFEPARDIWFSFGTNEEVSGDSAGLAAKWLKQRGVEPWFVLDEGGAVATDAFPSVTKPLAVVGVSEKGNMDVQLIARADSQVSHASTPPRMGPVARLARAIMRLERHPFPATLPEPVVRMLELLVPHVENKAMQKAFAQASRLKPVVAQAFARLGPETAAMTRTTVAVTQLEGSPSLNVLPQSASAGIDVRVQVGETLDSTVQRIRKIINDDLVEVKFLNGFEPSPVSDSDNEAFAALAEATKEVFPDAITIPYVALAASDARHFHVHWPQVYRFTPIRMNRAQRESVHGTNEYIFVDDLADAVRWYRALLELV